MEVSSHALHMGESMDVIIMLRCLLILSQDHLDYHQTMEEYNHAKSLLFSQLGNTFDDR